MRIEWSAEDADTERFFDTRADAIRWIQDHTFGGTVKQRLNDTVVTAEYIDPIFHDDE
jgi:hypothetical protein